MKENMDTQENINLKQKNPLESYNNFTMQKEEYSKEQKEELSKWRGSDKLNGAKWYLFFGKSSI